MKAWLKGGITGGLIFIIIVPSLWRIFPESLRILWLIPELFAEQFSKCYVMGSNNECSNILHQIITRIIYLFVGFVFGALIGWIIGKFKSEKKYIKYGKKR